MFFFRLGIQIMNYETSNLNVVLMLKHVCYKDQTTQRITYIF